MRFHCSTSISHVHLVPVRHDPVHHGLYPHHRHVNDFPTVSFWRNASRREVWTPRHRTCSQCVQWRHRLMEIFPGMKTETIRTGPDKTAETSCNAHLAGSQRLELLVARLLTRWKSTASTLDPHSSQVSSATNTLCASSNTLITTLHLKQDWHQMRTGADLLHGGNFEQQERFSNLKPNDEMIQCNELSQKWISQSYNVVVLSKPMEIW